MVCLYKKSWSKPEIFKRCLIDDYDDYDDDDNVSKWCEGKVYNLNWRDRATENFEIRSFVTPTKSSHCFQKVWLLFVVFLPWHSYPPWVRDSFSDETFTRCKQLLCAEVWLVKRKISLQIQCLAAYLLYPSFSRLRTRIICNKCCWKKLRVCMISLFIKQCYWLTDWLTDWSNWPPARPPAWMPARPPECPPDRPTDRSTDWLTYSVFEMNIRHWKDLFHFSHS